MRKTLNRKMYIDQVNKSLRVDEALYPRNNKDYRQGIINSCDSILIAHESYQGYQYMFADELDNPDNTPGVNGKNGQLEPMRTRFLGTDSTRIQFSI